ncbi:endonuclease/exonuclease/phosphatase family protein [Actinoallomurus rhizosphaericola]|uniref:endonuclease/exonuclease/phosphatase family protein n=1 Tax=Actinoallomurus rhizosphaericola TaxID=2952536 RepID=UPI00209374EE|nr:endonuclease/exonuclease/phosphatase family protein [Actinoallomurus rhizosphaericola]MCO5998957.1 endonuclease/exonuclease/phosphatase family protein [Actinoallomurus rhizosphaericola]
MTDSLTAAVTDPPRARRRGRAIVARSLVACFALWALARLFGADRIGSLAPVLIPAMAAVPYAFAAMVVPLTVSALVRDRPAFVAAVMVTVVFAGIVLPRAVAGGTPRASGPEFRVLTANLRFGRAGDATLVDLARRTRADVLGVEEFTPEAAGRLDAAGIGRLFPYRILDPKPGAAGIGLYSRYPLTPSPVRRPTISGMPSATVAVPGTAPVRVTAVHPPAPVGPDLDAWQHDFPRLPRATPAGQVGILAGDFNATLDHARLRRLIHSGYVDAADARGQGLVPTFRPLPPITIDHVLADRRCAVLRVKIYGQARSDHRALFTVLRLP